MTVNDIGQQVSIFFLFPCPDFSGSFGQPFASYVRSFTVTSASRLPFPFPCHIQQDMATDYVKCHRGTVARGH